MRFRGFVLLFVLYETNSTTPSPFPFRVRFDISDARYESSFVVKVHPLWAPIGALRFRELVAARFYDNTDILRVRRGILVSFACHAPALCSCCIIHTWSSLSRVSPQAQHGSADNEKAAPSCFGRLLLLLIAPTLSFFLLL